MVVLAATRFQLAHVKQWRDLTALVTEALTRLLNEEAPGLLEQVEREIAESPLDYSTKIPLRIRAARRAVTAADLAAIAAKLGTRDDLAEALENKGEKGKGRR